MYEIYVITNKINGKKYVGKTCQGIALRWSKHCEFAQRGRNIYFSSAIRKYGPEAFTHEIVAEAVDNTWASHLERMWILLLDTTNNSIGYNSTNGGEGFGSGDYNPNRIRPRRGKDSPSFGRPVSEEVRQKISKTLTGKLVGEKNPFFGKSHTPEMIRFFSESQKGKKTKPCSDETRRKIATANFGKKHSPERVEKMRQSKKGKYPTAEQKAPNITAQKIRRERELAAKYDITCENNMWTVHHRETGITVTHSVRVKALESINRKIKSSLRQAACYTTV